MRVTPVTRLDGTCAVPEDTACIATSFPGFRETLNRLAGAGAAGSPCVVPLP